MSVEDDNADELHGRPPATIHPIRVPDDDVEIVTLADPGPTQTRRRVRNNLVARCVYCDGVIVRRMIGPIGRSVWRHADSDRRECFRSDPTWRGTIPRGPTTD